MCVSLPFCVVCASRMCLVAFFWNGAQKCKHTQGYRRVTAIQGIRAVLINDVFGSLINVCVCIKAVDASDV